MHGRLLVAYSNSTNYVSTTSEYLESIGRHSGFEVRYVHVTQGAELEFDLNEFDAVFQSYCARLPFDNYVSDSYIEKLKSFRGVKLLAVQDEYDNFDKLSAAVQAIGYDVLFTNTSADLTTRLYPRERFPNTEFITVLTGYVPEALEAQRVARAPLRERPIHIGYRCRLVPAYYGRLCFEKFEIGRRMREICVARGIPHDIEWSDDKRLYGDAWYEFIGKCRTNLGSETGSNVFDLDGTVRATYDRLSAERGGPVPFEEFCVHTDPIEVQYDIGQISPRIFEAAALRTPLILFSGRYLNIIAPDEHYIELKKDFSNVDSVLERLDDLNGLERMADRAYQRLIASDDFSYRRFATMVGDTVRRKADERGVRLRAPTGRLMGDEYNPTAPASLREYPISTPRHPAVFFHRQEMRQAENSAAQIAQLNAGVTELQASLQATSAEINRLNEVYSDEIARLNQVYSSEITRLNEVIDTLSSRGQRAETGAEAERLVTGTPCRSLSSSRIRRWARSLVTRLPEHIGERTRMR